MSVQTVRSNEKSFEGVEFVILSVFYAWEARWRINLRDLTEHQANGTFLLFILLEKFRYLSLQNCFILKRSYSIVRSDCEV